MLCVQVVGLTLSSDEESLALLYLATVQALSVSLLFNSNLNVLKQLIFSTALV